MLSCTRRILILGGNTVDNIFIPQHPTFASSSFNLDSSTSSRRIDPATDHQHYQKGPVISHIRCSRLVPVSHSRAEQVGSSAQQVPLYDRRRYAV